jgi:aminoglycoside phosphotransferase (APT) family kinase protein
MTRIRPRALRGASIHRHAALAAWNRLHFPPAAISTLEIWRETPAHQPASVYRLQLENGGPASVFAKRCDAASCEVERMCYEEIVPRLALSSPTYYGSVEEPDGTCWVFLEDVGRERFSAHDPTHRALASRWIGRLHRMGAQVEAARRLPDAGPNRYLRHLRDGRDRIRQNLENPALTAEERQLLLEVLATLDRVEARWDAIPRACEGLPETVVHGDFRPKNVRIREEPTGPVLYPMDWELAGWGVPVVDLAPARGADDTLQVDPELYADILRGHGPALDRRDVERMSLIGFLLRKLAGIDWETLSLHHEDPMCLIGPVLSIQALHRALTAGLKRADAWLR